MKGRTRHVLIAILSGIPILFLGMIFFVNAFDWKYARPLLAKLSRSMSPYEVRVNGDWDMHVGRNFEIKLTDFSIHSASYPTDAPALAKSERFFLRVPIVSLFKARKVIDRIELTKTNVHLLRDENGKFLFLPPQKEEGPGERAEEGASLIRIPELNEIDVRDFGVAYEDRALRETATLSVDRIRSLAGEGLKPIHVQGRGRLEGQPFSLNATWEDTSGKNKGPFDFAMLLEIGRNRLVAEGKVVIDGSGGGLERAEVSFQADVKDPARIMRMVGIPSQKPVSLSVGGRLAAADEKITIEDMSLKTPRSALGVQGVLGTRERRPYVEARVDSERFDLRDVKSFMPPSETEAGEGEAKPEGGPVFSREPINLDALRSIDAKIAFSVKKFYADGALAILQSIRGDANLERGRLSVSVEDLGLGGGHLKARAEIDSEKGKEMTVKTQGAFSNVVLTAVVEPFDDKLKKADIPVGSLLGGKLSGDFGLRSHGLSIHDLAGHLNGAVSFALEDGQLNASLLNLANLDIVDAVKAWFAKQRGLKVPCVLAYLPIKDGVIRSEGLYANPALGEVLGDGYVDLGKEIYDIRFATKGDPPIGSDVIFPLHFKGKFGGGAVTKDEGRNAKDESIKETLPHARQKSVQVEQTEETTGCTKELRERYLPARDAAVAH